MSAFADAPRAGSAEAKVFRVLLPQMRKSMHPVQAAPRQRWPAFAHERYSRDAPRAGSAEAKRLDVHYYVVWGQMHPVQAAPRQSTAKIEATKPADDAPRAGSAEAKRMIRTQHHLLMGCTPCRQRRGKVLNHQSRRRNDSMHPVQAAPRQRPSSARPRPSGRRCTPCRQRRGKGARRCMPTHHSRCTPCRQRKAK